MEIEVARTDITMLAVDAIVNAANSALSGGGGVDGAVHRAAGPELLAECRALGRCVPGSAVITKGYRLPARYVIHAVGPVWQGGGQGEDALLASCHRAALQLAEDRGVNSLAFPAISCGAYRFPVLRAARIALGTIQEALPRCTSVNRVIFAVFEPSTERAFRAECSRIFGSSEAPS
jgi:O-acetyl-ADP-ribose deacetylase